MKTIQFNFSQSHFPATQLQIGHYNVVTTSHYSPHQHTPTLIVLSEMPQIYHGFINGYKQPVARVLLKVASFYAPHMKTLQTALNTYFNPYSMKFDSIQTEIDLARCLGEAVSAIQKTAGLPIFEAVQVDVSSNEDNLYTLWIPILHEDCFDQTMIFLLQFFIHHIVSTAFVFNNNMAEELNDLFNRLRAKAPKGINSLRLLDAAYQEEIPWVYLTNNIFQYGFGHLSRWLDSTFTDTTPHLGAEIAKNKCAALTILQRAALPVPMQRIAGNESEALEHANEIGYPIVIKPHNLDGGKGVQAWIMSDQQTQKAYANAKQFSDVVLVQKHIKGNDYRILVLHGKAVWAIERIPAGVTGDGRSTIKELIESTNQLRAQDKNGQTRLFPITPSEDMHDFLAEQGYDFNSILKARETVSLNRIANITAGGIPVAIFEQVHPDNKRLAESAAKLLRLDIAGIDIIMPDISKSYLKTDCAVIEVNAQPQLGIVTASHMYHHILNTLLPNQGRIPIIVVCCNTIEDLFIQQLHSRLKTQYNNIGMASDNFAYINNEKINHSTSLFHSAEALLLNTNIDALIYHIKQLDDIQYQGLPFDRYNCLFVLEAFINNSAISKETEYLLMNSLLKSCSGHSLFHETIADNFSHFFASHKPDNVSTKMNVLHEMEMNLFNWLQHTNESSKMSSYQYKTTL